METFLKKYRKYIIAVLLITVLLLISRFIASIDFDKFKTYVSEMPDMFVGVLVASLFSYSASTLAWSLCMGGEARKISFPKLFIYRNVGEMLSVFNPTSVVAGESLKAVILKRKGIDGTDGVSSILLHRVLIIFSGIFLMAISFLHLTVGKFANNGANFLLILIVISFVSALGYIVLRFMVHPKLFLGKTIEYLKTKTGWKFLTDKLVNSSYEMNRVTSVYFRENKGRFLLAFLLCVIHWIFGAMEFFVVLKMMGMNITLIQAVIIEMGVIFFKNIGSIIPAQIGVEEYGNKVMLDVIGIASNEIWLVVTLMRRGRQLFWLLIAGISMMIISRKKGIKTELKRDIKTELKDDTNTELKIDQ